MNKHTYDMIERVKRVGITEPDAWALRRISMTLSKWFEMECGNGNDYASWSIERDEETDKPYLCTYPHTGAMYKRQIPDREKGARKRLATIMQRYPALVAYVQTDPRGASLYIVKRSDLEGNRIVEQAQGAGFKWEKANKKTRDGFHLYQSQQLQGKTFTTPEQGAVWYLKAQGITPLESRNLPIDSYYTRGIAVYK